MKPVILKPLDVVILLKIVSQENHSWDQIGLAHELHLSQSEISKSLSRSHYAQLLSKTKKEVFGEALFNFIRYGLPYVFPQRPGHVTRGVPTAHSSPFVQDDFRTDDVYVWPYHKGKSRGQSVIPLYENAPLAALQDDQLYKLLAMIDILRIGRAREKNVAIKFLKETLCPKTPKLIS